MNSGAGAPDISHCSTEASSSCLFNACALTSEPVTKQRVSGTIRPGLQSNRDGSVLLMAAGICKARKGFVLTECERNSVDGITIGKVNLSTRTHKREATPGAQPTSQT